jgi:hypothetical protein
MPGGAMPPGQNPFGQNPFGQGAPNPFGPGAQNPFGPGGPMMPGQGFQAPRRSRSGLGWVWFLVAVIVLGSAAVGIVVALKANDKKNEVLDQINNPGGTGTTAKGSSAPLWSQAAFPQQLDDAIAGTPTEFVEIVMYPEYAEATARDPNQRQHLDTYDFRKGKAGFARPEQNQDDLEGKTFTVTDIPWAKLDGLVAEASTKVNVENPTSTYIIIDKGTFGGTDLTIRVYISGPRNSAYVEADKNATIVTIYGG